MDSDNCVTCNSSLYKKQTNVFCATCKAKFCSSKCKQFAKKKHGGGRCTLVPTDRNLGKASSSYAMPVFRGPDGKEVAMLIDHDVEELICGGSIGDMIAILPLKSGGYAPICPAWRVFQLMNDVAQYHRDFFCKFVPEENRPKWNEGQEILDSDRQGNLFVFTFTNFEDFARMYLDLGGKIAAAKNASGRRFEEEITREEIRTGYRRFPTLQCFTKITPELIKRFAFNLHALGCADMLMGMGCDAILVCVETETVREIPTGRLCYDLYRLYPWSPGRSGLFHLLRNANGTLIDIACMDERNPSARKGETLIGDIHRIAPDAYENHRIWLQAQLNTKEENIPPHINAIWDLIEGQVSQYDVETL